MVNNMVNVTSAFQKGGAFHYIVDDQFKRQINTGLFEALAILLPETYGVEIFEKSGEPWGIDVVKKALLNKNTLFFVAFYRDVPVGMTYCHITDDVCRVDYLLVSKEYRNKGIGRAIIDSFVKDCEQNKIRNCYLWPDGETAEKIYYEAGFRLVETKQAGRAMIK